MDNINNIKKILDQCHAGKISSTFGDVNWWATLDLARNELADLEKDRKKLRALERGGVDNWTWYDQAMESLDS